MCVRFYFYVAQLPSTFPSGIISAVSSLSDPALKIEIGTDGKLRLSLKAGATQTAYTATALALNIWYRIDLHFTIGATGTYNLRINGVSELSSGSADMGTGVVNSFMLGRIEVSNQSAINFYYDDMCVSDTNAEIGPGLVVRMDPNGAGYSAWTAQTGTFADVDDYIATANNDGDTSFISTADAGVENLGIALESAASAGVVGTIRATKAIVVCRRVAGTAVAWQGGTRSSTTNAVLTTLDGLDSYEQISQRNHLRTTAPHSGAAWTLADLDGAEVLCIKTQTQARELRCTAMALCVECNTTNIENYLPPTPGSDGQKARLRR
jgi:hypothetical protein